MSQATHLIIEMVSHLVRISVTSLDWLATRTALGLRGFATTLIFFLVVSGDWTHILRFVQRMLYRLSYLPPGIWIFLRITPSDLDADPRKSFLRNTALHWALIFVLTPRHLLLVSWHPPFFKTGCFNVYLINDMAEQSLAEFPRRNTMWVTYLTLSFIMASFFSENQLYFNIIYK